MSIKSDSMTACDCSRSSSSFWMTHCLSCSAATRSSVQGWKRIDASDDGSSRTASSDLNVISSFIPMKSPDWCPVWHGLQVLRVLCQLSPVSCVGHRIATHRIALMHYQQLRLGAVLARAQPCDGAWKARSCSRLLAP